MANRKTQIKRGPKPMSLMQRGANIAFAIIVALAYLAAAVEIGFGGIDGHLTEKICVALLALSALSGAVLIVSQSLKDAGPISLFISAAAALACGFALEMAARYVLPSALGVSRIFDIRVIDAAMMSCAFYLMLWERGGRVEIGADDTIDALRAVGCLWPMGLLYALIIGVEYLIW